MTYYKIILNNIIIAVGTSFNLRRVQDKHQILVISDENHAQYIQNNEILYRDNWFAAETSTKYKSILANISIISYEEYLTLKQQIDEGNQLYIPDEPIPEPVPEQIIIEDNQETSKTRLQILEEQIKNLTATNEMLEECLLEISEIIYA